MSVVIVVGPGRGTTGPGVRDVLRDWSAVGLLHPFAWIDEGDAARARDGLQQVPASVVADGGSRRVTLSDYLANQRRVEGVRLVVLSAPGVDDAVIDPADAAELQTRLTRAFDATVAMHCIVPRHGDGRWQPDLGWFGWQNIVLAPEQSWHPKAMRVVLTDRDSDTEFVGHAATGVATLSGLWREMAETPFDHALPASQGAVNVARVFVRRVTAGDVQHALQMELTDVSAGLPRPRANRTERLASVDDELAAAQRMADALRAKHSAVFTRSRRQATSVPQTKLRPLQALRMMFAFLGAALRNAPRQWAEGVLARASTSAARHLSAVFGGDNSAFTVVVNGRDGRGRLVDVDDLLGGVQRCNEALSQVGAAADLSTPATAPFWRDFVMGAMTLGDGEQHTAGLPPVTSGGRPAVLLSPDAIAPAAAAPYTVRGRTAQRVGNEPLQAYDVLAVRRVRDDLNNLVERDPGAAIEASTERGRLDEWAQHVRSSYAGRVGKALTDQILRSQADMGHLQRQLEEATRAADFGQGEQLSQSRLARLQLSMLAVLVATLVVLWLLWKVDVLSTLWAITLSALAVVIWVVAATVAFVSAQVALFQLLHRRQQLAQDSEIALANLQAANRELHIAAYTYRQYQRWAPVLGAFLHAPFGPVTASADRGTTLGGALPRSFGLSHATPSSEGVSRIVDRLASELFPQGWLGRQWELLLTDAPHRLGPAGLAIEDDPTALYADPADRSDSPLVTWASALQSEGTGASQATAFWTLAKRALRQLDPQDVTTGLMPQLEIVGQEHHAMPAMSTGEAFLDDLLTTTVATRAQNFDIELFTPAAVGHNAQRVARTFVCAAGRAVPAAAEDVDYLPPMPLADDSLDQFLGVVQLSDGLSAAELTLSGGKRLTGDPGVIPTSTQPIHL